MIETHKKECRMKGKILHDAKERVETIRTKTKVCNCRQGRGGRRGGRNRGKRRVEKREM